MDDPKQNLKICIIGAGMAGLTSALALKKEGFKNVEVFETAPDLGFVGAGIQLAPNMSRILDGLGVWKDIEREAVELKRTSIREGSTDEELGSVELGYIQEEYGYPHMVGHRHSLTQGLYHGCKKYPDLKFHFGTSVHEVHDFFPRPAFTISSRGGEKERVECDVLLACDGIKSRIREKMLRDLGVDAKVVDSEQAAYRILLTREQMEDDPELLELINTSGVSRWIGERRHIIAYPISSKRIYNISTTQPDINFAISPSETYTTKGSKTTMLKVFEDFNPKVRRMLNLVPDGEVCEWKLRLHAPLPTWVRGSMALVGDACHPTLPHLAQGAAQAVEDGAVVAVCLGMLEDGTRESVNRALKVYEKIRKERAEKIVELAAASARSLHLGEGKLKEERDRLFRDLREGRGKGVPDKWADREVQKMVYGVDCVGIARERFGEFWEEVERKG
ncbi:putative salicylate hydroxylase protein [Botrytis fragariae]|uniref:Putative salicylate hydroxylase protein n=1 Tax=Botrytis fragariae TaxID=1964551 RepID=A0A8H6ASA7_9HELO|nr:putative salicylate hydroxylase protein [Botrytis fragariae]KAF5872653.1 putative salicylate hydroxylase protein [Botrytis fragariae]